MRRVAACLLTALLPSLLLAGGSTSASAQDDTQAPTLVSAGVNPTRVDVGERAQDVTVTLRITDEGSGTAHVVAGLQSTTSTQQKLVAFALAAGTVQDGTWTGTVTLPRTATTGEWRITISNLEDTTGNRTYGATGHTPGRVADA